MVSGIGQAAKAPHYLNANVFDGLHGRALPAAQGIKVANPSLTVIAESGDGCSYGEGGNHFISAIRRNVDITLVVHNNQIYGLTKGQASPTTEEGFVTKAQPQGVASEPFNPIEVAVAMRASFVARSFSGMKDHLSRVIEAAIGHKGFSLVDVLQPCVTFNKVNNFAWYKKRCREMPPGYDPRDWDAAVKVAGKWGEEIPVGVIYTNDRPAYSDRLGPSQASGLVGKAVDRAELAKIMESYR
jgi:2-oxoglutarate ferredoxin oxidoreductase subunit beta